MIVVVVVHQLSRGPQVRIRLRANVVVPDLCLSVDCLNFGCVRVGQCRVITVQMCNRGPVACHWVTCLFKAPEACLKNNQLNLFDLRIK